MSNITQTKRQLSRYAIRMIRAAKFWTPGPKKKSILEQFGLLGCVYVSDSAKPLFIGEAELKQSYLAHHCEATLLTVNKTNHKKLGHFRKKLKKILLLLTESRNKPV